MENSKTVLVTGRTGFLGMRIVLQLLQQCYMVQTRTGSDHGQEITHLQHRKLNTC